MKIERLTAEQEAILPKFRAEWLQWGINTDRADRAKAEASVWNPGDGFFPGDYEYTMFSTMRMAELTELYHQGNDVGGPARHPQVHRRQG